MVPPVVARDASRPAPGPLTLERQGSFFVGGRDVRSDALSTLSAYAPSTRSPWTRCTSVTRSRSASRGATACRDFVVTAKLDRVLPETGFLVLACPLTARTHGLLDRRRIALLPRGAGVVNVGRGALVEQDALLDALDARRLGGAVLDVFTPEPVPPGHRLWRTPNLVMTPHMSSDDPETYVAHSLKIFFANLAAYAEG